MASGLTLIYGVMRILNIAHGSLYALGAYAAASLAGAWLAAGYAAIGSFAMLLLAALLVGAVDGAAARARPAQMDVRPRRGRVAADHLRGVPHPRRRDQADLGCRLAAAAGALRAARQLQPRRPRLPVLQPAADRRRRRHRLRADLGPHPHAPGQAPARRDPRSRDQRRHGDRRRPRLSRHLHDRRDARRRSAARSPRRRSRSAPASASR